MIKQHYYTWTERGLFRQDAGPDTVAKSKGLQNELIVNVLHENCFYDSPNKLNELVEENKDQYPLIQMGYRCDSGEMVIGRTVFLLTKIQGENAFFTHNFIIHPSKLKDVLRHLCDTLYITDFKNQCDSSRDMNLPELTLFHYESGRTAHAENPDPVLLGYGINEQIFKLMLSTLIECVEKNRRMYVVLNERTGKLFDSARIVLKHMIAALPYSYRKRLGYITYAGKRTVLKDIHLYFLEKDYAGYLDKDDLKGYLFEFVNNEFNVASDVTDTLFLNYAWECRAQENSAFLEFVSSVSAVETPPLSFLDEMAVLWQLKGSDSFELYKKNRLFTTQTLNKYAAAKNQLLKPTIREIYLTILEVEQRDRRNVGNYFTEAPVMAEIVKLAETVIDNEMEEAAIKFCTDTVVEARDAEAIDYINAFLTSIMDCRRFFKRLQGVLCEKHWDGLESVMFSFVIQRLDMVDTAQNLIDEIEFWWANNPTVLSDSEVAKSFGERAKKIFSASPDPVIEGTNLHTRMEYMLRNIGQGEKKHTIFDFSKAILEIVDRSVLDFIKFETVSIEQLQNLKIDTDSLKADEKYKSFMALKGFVCSETKYTMDKALAYMKNQGQYAYTRFFETIKRLLKAKISAENYDKIIVIFQDTEGVPQFREIFEFISENKNRGETCNFIKWAFRREMFTEQYTEFNNAVVDFFAKFTPKEFKQVLKNYAYLYTNENLNGSEKNLRHIIDVFKNKNAIIAKPTSSKDIKGMGTILLIALSLIAGIVLIFALFMTLSGK